MTTDRLALYGALTVAAGASLAYFPAGVVLLGCIMVLAAVLQAWQRGQDG